jgi:hypothetical protein
MSVPTLNFQHEAVPLWPPVAIKSAQGSHQSGAGSTERRGMVPRLPSPRGPSVELANWPAQRRTSHE